MTQMTDDSLSRHTNNTSKMNNVNFGILTEKWWNNTDYYNTHCGNYRYKFLGDDFLWRIIWTVKENINK